MVRAYDTWDFFDRQYFHPDGSMTDEYRKLLMADGCSLWDTFAMEAEQMKQVKAFEDQENFFLQQYGITYTDWINSAPRSITDEELEAKQRAAILAGEELSTLPIAIDPDEYYDF